MLNSSEKVSIHSLFVDFSSKSTRLDIRLPTTKNADCPRCFLKCVCSRTIHTHEKRAGERNASSSGHHKSATLQLLKFDSGPTDSAPEPGASFCPVSQEIMR